MHRLKQSRTSPHSPGPQPETLTTASGPDDAVDVSHGRELWTSSSYTAVAVSLTEFDPAKLESRHDALDSPSTLCIRVPSPLAWGRNNVRELRAQKRHVLRDGGRSSILTACPFRTAVRSRYLLRTAACYKYQVPGTGTWYHT